MRTPREYTLRYFGPFKVPKCVLPGNLDLWEVGGRREYTLRYFGPLKVQKWVLPGNLDLWEAGGRREYTFRYFGPLKVQNACFQAIWVSETWGGGGSTHLGILGP